MAAKTSWHRYETKLRRWYPLYKQCAVIIFFAASHAQSAKMRPIVTDVPRSVCVSVCLLDTNVRPAKTAEPIEVSCGTLSRVGRKNYGARIPPPNGRGIFGGGARAMRPSVEIL